MLIYPGEFYLDIFLFQSANVAGNDNDSISKWHVPLKTTIRISKIILIREPNQQHILLNCDAAPLIPDKRIGGSKICD